MSTFLIIALIVGAFLVYKSQTSARESNETEGSSRAKTSLDDLLKATQTPTGAILTWSFNLSCDTDTLLRKKIPEITRYPDLKQFANLLQAAHIIATMLRIERHLGDIDHSALHKNIVESISPSVRGPYMKLLKELIGFLFKTSEIVPPTTDENTIPPFNKLIKKDDEFLAMTIAFWVVGWMKMARPDDSDAAFAIALRGIIYETNAKLMSSMYLSGKTDMSIEDLKTAI